MHPGKIAGILSVLVFVGTGLKAQEKFTMAEATNGMATTLAPQSIKQASWRPGTNTFTQVVKNGDDESMTATDLPAEDSYTLLHLADINNALHNDLKSMPAIKWLDKDNLYFTDKQTLEKGKVSAAGISWNKWATLPAEAKNVSPDKSGKIAYTIDNNLWLVNNGKAVAVTKDANKNIVNGQSVHREEFGIDHGIFFSPKGNYLAYYRMDQTMVNDYPIIRWDTVPAQVDLIKYPMAGGTSHQVTLCVYNPATRRTVTMQTGVPKDHYLTCVTWGPDEQYIYIAILNRDQNHLWLNKYEAQSGKKVKTLFEETDTRYVHPEHGLTFLPAVSDKFIWWSDRDGYRHLYLYNTDGKLIRQVTRGKWVVNELLGFNEKNEEVLITASKESPMEKHGYTVNWNTGEMNRIDKGAGMHTILPSDDGKYVFDVYSNADVAKKSVLRSTDGKYSKVVLDAPDPLAGYDRPEVKNVTLEASDGTPLYGKLILPLHFNPNRKYPVIVYLYNGPNVQLLHNSFPASGNLWYEYMAQHGYIVFTMDGRGSLNRGMAFEQATFRHLGEVELDDQMKGVKYLWSLPYVDRERMGIHGWSFGGFMTTNMMLKHPGVFKCAVAGGPVMDWKMYEVMYTERYMDRPQDNPEGYEQANLLDKVKSLKGKLLLIHGTQDNVVVWQHSIRFLKKCVDEGVQLDYFVYPGYEHNVRGKDRVHLMQKITDYFDTYLR
ncbi:MAG: S9 family peptidase [Bacteroidetes bacterium 46-16]|nr:MAG: S9 family peptidase [Bacteroidetes bacterium 46-16]